MYTLLGLCLMLAGFWALNALATSAAVICWHTMQPWTHGWPASRQAQYLFLLRVVPPVTTALVIVSMAVPAYLTYEPQATGEVVGWKLGALALLSGSGLAVALWRGLRTWQATRSLIGTWLDRAHCIELAGLAVPVYRLQHEFPVIAVIGLVRPRLFLAEQVIGKLTPEELSAAVTHECGHLAAHDNMKRTLLRACRDVLPIVPGGALDREWANAAESAADDYAAQKGSTVGLELASALVKIARLAPANRRPSMLAAAHFSGSGSSGALARRVQRLAECNPHRSVNPPSRKDSGLAPLFGALGFLLAAITWCACNTPALLLVHGVLEHVVAFLG